MLLNLFNKILLFVSPNNVCSPIISKTSNIWCCIYWLCMHSMLQKFDTNFWFSELLLGSMSSSISHFVKINVVLYIYIWSTHTESQPAHRIWRISPTITIFVMQEKEKANVIVCCHSIDMNPNHTHTRTFTRTPHSSTHTHTHNIEKVFVNLGPCSGNSPTSSS